MNKGRMNEERKEEWKNGRMEERKEKGRKEEREKGGKGERKGTESWFHIVSLLTTS